MSVMYDNYLAEHISNVQKALQWMADMISLPEISQMSWTMALEKAKKHDESKYYKEEYDAYDHYFYGKDKTPRVREEFDYAWLHHQKNNLHHWQYWLLVNDDPNDEGAQIVPLQMPVCCILEMIADWWSFSWKKNNLEEIFYWYDDHRNEIILHPDTRELVEKILDKMRKVITMQKRREGSYD